MIARALFLLLLAVLAHWPQLTLPDWRGTEGRRLQIALEMVQSGDWMVPTLGHEPTWAKPPLHYWILGAVEGVGGESFLLLRLVSVLGLWGLALLAFGLLQRPFGAAASWIGALGVLLAPVLLASAGSIEIDPLFMELTAGSLLLLAHGVARDHRASVVWSGLLGGLALLSKGPPYFMFAIGAWVAWWRGRGARHVLSYFLALLVLPLLYFVPLLTVYVRPRAFGAIAGEESIGRMLGYSWKRVFDIPVFWLKCAGLLLPLAAWFGRDRRLDRDRGEADRLMLRMCRAAVYGAVLVLTCFPARPTRYLLPIVPLFAVAMAPAVADWIRAGREPGAWAQRIRWAIGVFGALFLIATPWLPLPFPGRAPALALALALLPLLAPTRQMLVAACFWLPLLGSWTAILDQADLWNEGGRGRTQVGRLLRAELDELGATGHLQTIGHVNSNLLLGAGMLPPGDEMARGALTLPFALHEDAVAGELNRFPAYRPRLILCVPGDRYTLRQRRD